MNQTSMTSLAALLNFKTKALSGSDEFFGREDGQFLAHKKLSSRQLKLKFALHFKKRRVG